MNKEYFLNKLNSNRPSVFETNNYDLLPETFLAHDKISITCIHHGIFYQKAYSHLQGSSCPACGELKTRDGVTLTTEEFIAKSMSKFGDRFNYLKTKYVRKDIPLTITCQHHGDITLTPDQHRWSKHGCPQCDFEIPRRIKQQKFIDLAKQIHGNKYSYDKVSLINTTNKVEIICFKHGSFWQSPFDHAKRHYDCPKCMLEANKLSKDDFIAKSKILHQDKYNYDKVVYETNTSMVTITCKKHGDFIQRAASHLAGCVCKKCFIEDQRKSTEEFVKNATLIHGNKYNYSKVNYHGNKQHVEIICPTHGSFWQRPNSHLSNNQGCKLCFESKGEIAIEIFLKKYNLNYIREYRVLPYFYRYDFYLPELNIFIEFNGYQHYSPVEFFGGEEAFNLTKERDLNKKQIVKDNKGQLVIITYIHLGSNSVEKELIIRLKQVYRYWFVVDGKLQVFNNVLEIYNTFKLPKNILVRDIEKELEKTIKNFRVLF